MSWRSGCKKVIQWILIGGLVIGGCTALDVLQAGYNVVPSSACVRDPQTIVVEYLEGGPSDSGTTTRDVVEVGKSLRSLERIGDDLWFAHFKRYSWTGSAVLRRCRPAELPDEERMPAAIAEAVVVARGGLQ
jgi:hypothetical protein